MQNLLLLISSVLYKLFAEKKNRQQTVTVNEKKNQQQIVAVSVNYFRKNFIVYVSLGSEYTSD